MKRIPIKLDLSNRTTATILVALCLLSPTAFGQEDAQHTERERSTSSTALIEINRGIRAYLDGDYDRAEVLLQAILQNDPENAACLYYLGLIHLNRGLRFSADQNKDAARAEFDLGRINFEKITLAADPSVTPVEAALLLGIAQLAAEGPKDTGAVVEPAIAAQKTLQKYVETIDVGKNDRYGFFYLGVAQYRLGDHYNATGQYRQAGEHLAGAVKSLETALRVAEIDRQRAQQQPDAPRGLTPEGYEHFNQVVSYYRGLVALQRRHNSEARRLLEYVRQQEHGQLGQNAGIILAKLDEIEAESPLPLSFDSPLGKLDFQGDISFGTGYDTNVILLGKDTILPLGIGRKYDFNFDTSANFYINRYIDKTEAPIGESLSLGLGAGTAHSWYTDIKEFDQNLYAGRAYVQWQPLKNLYLGMEYEYSYTLLGRDPFISSHRLTPVLSRIWQNGSNNVEVGRTDLWYNYDYRDYRGSLSDFRFNRDGEYQSIGLRHTFNLIRAADLWPTYFTNHESEKRFFAHKWFNVSLGYLYRDERTDGTEFDLVGHSLLSSVELPLPHRFALACNGIFTWENYGAPSLFDYRRNSRADFVQRYEIGLIRTFVARGQCARLPTLEIKLRAGMAFTIRNSNIWDRLSQDVYEYNRAVYGVQLNIDF